MHSQKTFSLGVTDISISIDNSRYDRNSQKNSRHSNYKEVIWPPLHCTFYFGAHAEKTPKDTKSSGAGDERSGTCRAS